MEKWKPFCLLMTYFITPVLNISYNDDITLSREFMKDGWQWFFSEERQKKRREEGKKERLEEFCLICD